MGHRLERILIPRDLRGKLFSSAAPVVLTLDATTARIPWEMLMIPSVSVLSNKGKQSFAGPWSDADPERFLGTAAGFGVTRQLRTAFAPAGSDRFLDSLTRSK